MLKGNGTAIIQGIAGTDYTSPAGAETVSNKNLANETSLSVGGSGDARFISTVTGKSYSTDFVLPSSGTLGMGVYSTGGVYKSLDPSGNYGFVQSIDPVAGVYKLSHAAGSTGVDSTVTTFPGFIIDRSGYIGFDVSSINPDMATSSLRIQASSAHGISAAIFSAGLYFSSSSGSYKYSWGYTNKSAWQLNSDNLYVWLQVAPPNMGVSGAVASPVMALTIDSTTGATITKGLSVNGNFNVVGGASVAGALDVNNIIRARGAPSVWPTSGLGLELFHNVPEGPKGTSYVQTYDRGGGGYLPLMYSAASHTWTCNAVQRMVLTDNLTTPDIYPNRTSTTGAIFFGTPGVTGAYHYYNGSNHEIQAGSFNVYSNVVVGMGVGGGNTAHATLDIRLASDTSLCVYASGPYAIMGAHNIAATAYKDLHFVANLHVGPFSDNAINSGYGGNRWQNVYAVNGTVNTSDERLKTEIRPSSLGLDFINALLPISYKWVVGGNRATLEEDGTEIEPGYTTIDGKKIPPRTKPKYVNVTTPIPGVRTHWGLGAQQVKSVLDAQGVVDFAGYVVDDVNDPNSTQSLRYHEFIGPMIKAIQELSAKVKALEAQLAAQP